MASHSSITTIRTINRFSSLMDSLQISSVSKLTNSCPGKLYCWYVRCTALCPSSAPSIFPVTTFRVQQGCPVPCTSFHHKYTPVFNQWQGCIPLMSDHDYRCYFSASDSILTLRGPTKCTWPPRSFTCTEFLRDTLHE